MPGFPARMNDQGSRGLPEFPKSENKSDKDVGKAARDPEFIVFELILQH
jgi:hypothetical protein